MYVKKMVYVVTAFIADFENSGFREPSDSFLCPTYQDALDVWEECSHDPIYAEVIIDGPLEKEVWQ